MMYLELFFTFFKIGLFTFGGGYSIFPLLEKELVIKRNWAKVEEIIDFFAIAQVTPGAIAVNTATLIGYKKKKTLGGVIATLGLVSPSIIIVSILSVFLTSYLEYPIIKNLTNGINIAVCAIMSKAIFELFKKSIKDIITFMVFMLVLILSIFYNIQSIYLVFLCIVIGLVIVYIRGINEHN